MYAPFLLSTGDPAALLPTGGAGPPRGRANDTLYAVFAAAGEGLNASGWFGSAERSWRRDGHDLAVVPLALAALALLAVGWRRGWPLHRAAFALLLFYVAAAPVVQPWHVGLLLPFLCIYPRLGLLAFTGTVFLAYHPLPGWQAGEGWNESRWVKALEYAPFYGALLAMMVPRRQAVPTRSPPPEPLRR